MNLQKENLKYFEEYQNLVKENRTSEAIFVLEQRASMLLNILGVAYSSELKNQDKARTCFDAALTLDPTSVNACSNLSHICNVQGKLQEGLGFSNRSIVYSNGLSYEGFYNQGVILLAMGRTHDAMKMFQRATEIDPKNQNSNYNLGLSILKLGLSQKGWDQYEWRFESNKTCNIFKSRCNKIWNGEDIKGKTLFIFNEQGYGDFIFFLRFIPEIRKLGCKLIFEVQKVLFPLVRDVLNEDEIIFREDVGVLPDLPESDYQVSICSLAKIFQIDEDSKVPDNCVIKSIEHKNLDIFKKHKTKVGLCWFGNTNHVKDHCRSTYISNFKEILDVPNVGFFGLGKNGFQTRTWPCGQVNLNKNIQELNIVNLESEINDFGDLASFINSMDLIISVDTVVAHIAGLLGKKTFLILGKESDFRWQENREDTPWYPSMKIFRFDESWQKTISNVNKSFLDFLHEKI